MATNIYNCYKKKKTFSRGRRLSVQLQAVGELFRAPLDGAAILNWP
jgi:hypothetical protein